MKYVTYQKKRTGDSYAQRKKARQHLAEARRLLSKSRLPLLHMTDEQIIQALRKTRQELWEAKFASRPR